MSDFQVKTLRVQLDRLMEKHVDLTAALEKMDERCRVLEAETDLYRRALGQFTVPIGFLDLAGKPLLILGAILEADVATRGMLIASAYEDHEPRPASDNSIKAHVAALRRRLEPFGIEIQNKHSIGYFMPGGSKALLRQMIEAFKQQRTN
jgi:hypothetical protein